MTPRDRATICDMIKNAKSVDLMVASLAAEDAHASKAKVEAVSKFCRTRNDFVLIAIRKAR
jgi:hypothetical protein